METSQQPLVLTSLTILSLTLNGLSPLSPASQEIWVKYTTDFIDEIIAVGFSAAINVTKQDPPYLLESLQRSELEAAENVTQTIDIAVRQRGGIPNSTTIKKILFDAISRTCEGSVQTYFDKGC